MKTHPQDLRRLFVPLLVGFLLGASALGCHSSGAAAAAGDTSQLRLIGKAGRPPAALASFSRRAVTRAVLTGSVATAAVVSACPTLGVITPFAAANAGDVVYQTCVGAYYESNMDSGDVGLGPTLFYVSTDCSGAPLATVGSGGTMPGVYRRAGFAFTAPDGSAWQVAPNQATVTATIASVSTFGSCSPAAETGSFFLAAVPIDGSLGVAGGNVGGDQTLVAP